MSHECSITVLESTLAGTLPAEDEAALYRHLESCAECSAALERLSGGTDWCEEAATLLHGAELDADVPADEEWSVVDFSVEHLEPSDEPNVLGRLGGYDVLEVIGQGGMGVVLKGFDRELRRCVAIKVLAPHLAASNLAKQRFAREAQAAASIVHPNVLAIHHVQPGGRLPFLVMPLLAGESLAERLTKQGRLELKEVLRIGMQAAAGLAAAHEQGLVHRDVKPANILLEKGVERAVLTDFGLARAADDVTLTRWGVIAGTPQYMSPEQARGEPLDGRSDLFSLGCVLYEMATGVSPFRSDSVVATLRRLVDDSPRAMAALNPELPPWFIHIVERLLDKDPVQRFESAHEVSDLLENCLAHVQQPAAVPLPMAVVSNVAQRPRRRSRPRIVGAFAMIAALGIGVFGVMLATATPPDIAGDWRGEEWGDVVLGSTGEGEYVGTYSETLSGRPGAIELQWSRIERRFNGTWSEGADRFGEISVRLVDDEIRGALTTDPQSRDVSTRPRLAEFSWHRVEADDAEETAATEGESGAHDLTGTWNVTRFSGADEMSGFTLHLKQDDRQLTGSITSSDGTTSGIAAAQFADGVVSFRVARESFIQDYSGAFDGDTIEGKWAAGIAVFDWRAVRVDTDAEATSGNTPAPPSATEELQLPEQLMATREHIVRIEALIEDAPVTTSYLAELFERIPGTDSEYRLREDVFVIPIRRAEVSALDDDPLGTVYYLPGSKSFYIQWDDIGAGALHYYGPFYVQLGVELETLGLVLRTQVGDDDSDASPSGTGPSENAQDVDSDLERLQGTWEGQAVSVDVMHLLTIEGTSFTEVQTYSGDVEITLQGSIDLDESADPRRMLMSVSSSSISSGRGPGRLPREIYAIYRIDDQGLTIRTGRSDYPTQFDDNDSRQTVFNRHELRETEQEDSTTEEGSQLPGRNPPDADRDQDGDTVDIRERLIGEWIGQTNRTGERYLFRADSTFEHVVLNATSAGTWDMDLDTLPPTVLMKVTSSDDPEFPVDYIDTQRIARLDDERLSFENREEDEIFGLAGDPEPILFTRKPPLSRTGEYLHAADEAGAESGIDTGDDAPCPTHEELMGTWQGHDNGLAQVFFTLELSDNGAFALHRRDLAPQFEETTRGTWELDADEGQLILRQESETAPGGLEFTDHMRITREAGELILTYAVQGRYVRHEPERE